ncbi:hypothetical protein IFM89_036348 [Coptis chinensis]|uniref:Endonuclease/exonuclease/phosphatase domain-containing protein n=1 Tax=Coptis chinensis TaxID=261450 RepID=A0A835HJ16_9MAGN|nr:hypothetical protein IFM89_036348 [Coptis chinensis]
MGTSTVAQTLKEMIRRHNPDVIFLVETKASSIKIKSLQKSLRYPSAFVVDVGHSGGLALLYKDKIDIEIIGAGKHAITRKFSNYLAEGDWFITLVYGHPISHKRSLV